MLNYIWLGLIVSAVLLAGFNHQLKESVDGALNGARIAVELSIGLVGLMALWLGVMRLAEKAGLIHAVARFLRPLLVRLFPEVPADHPAMGSIVMNLAANMLGLNNAATPLGLRAMKDLETLNPHPGVATNAMCTFLAINTSSVQLLPMTAVAVLAAAGSLNPTAIIGTSLLATTCSTTAGIISVKLLEKLRRFRISPNTQTATEAPPTEFHASPTVAEVAPIPVWGKIALIFFALCFVWFFVGLSLAPDSIGLQTEAASPLWIRAINAISLLAIPFLLSFFPLYAALRQIKVYEEFVEGAKEGFQVAIRIIPFLVAMLVAIGMFRGARGIELITDFLRPVLAIVQFPPELVPISLIRPLSGSGTLAVFGDLVKAHGADSMIARMAGTIFGSTETTFYVVVVYFGSIAVRRTRHAVPAGLIADAVGVIASVIICRLAFA